ncbi:MAG: hypothetical protein KDD45_03860 [Bdellovibrionales bacterium]|nr:hypothetical protein [Bdellovibrionales bacterium]
MKHLKLKLLAILALLPLPDSLAHAVSYYNVIDQTSVYEFDYEAEFFRRLESGLLREAYYNYLFERGIDNTDDLMLPENAPVLNTLQKNFKKEYGNIQLAADTAGSIQPD